MEAKLDALLRLHGGEQAENVIREIDERYLRGGSHAKPHAHGEDPIQFDPKSR